jgi:hypothetical protein
MHLSQKSQIIGVFISLMGFQGHSGAALRGESLETVVTDMYTRTYITGSSSLCDG